MARALVACARDKKIIDDILPKIGWLNRRLTPDHLPVVPPFVDRRDHFLTVLINPPVDLDWYEGNFCLGKMIKPAPDWWKRATGIPDGSFALFRQDQDGFEIATDKVGSRTVWYFQNEDIFLASNSQRAILCILGNFSINPQTVTWMLSSGSTGPGLAWDARLKMLPGDSRLSFDFRLWKLEVTEIPPDFSEESRPDSEHGILLRQAIEKTLQRLDLDYNNWLLPLSGGYDSRAILLMIPEKSDLKCITWGVRSSLQDSRNDAYVARQLAQECGVNFHFFPIEPGNEPLELIFERFIAASEGRIDHISAYMDGFQIWQHLHQQKMSGVIRGDEGFGWTRVYSADDVRRYTGLVTMEDHRNLRPAEDYGMSVQSIPDWLHKKDGETLSVWRDRIYHQYRIPTILAALNEIKAAYVEVINPLLSRIIIERVRTLPDALRTEKKLFKQIITRLSPAIPFAEKPAIAPAVNYLNNSTAARLFKDEMEDVRGRNILPNHFLDWVENGIKSSSINGAPAERPTVKEFIPSSMRPLLKSLYGKQNISINHLAFRIYIIGRIINIIEKDTIDDRSGVGGDY